MNDWLSTEQAADRCGVTVRTLYRFIDTGDLPAYRFGRVIRLRPAEVDNFIESRRVQPGDLTLPRPYDGPRHIGKAS